MAVTSIWRVNGWLGKVVVYVENPDKTTNPEFYENGNMTERECQGLDDVIAYAVNSRKTEQHKEDSDVLERFVSGVNCHPATARAEMMAVKKRFGKEDGTIAYHGYQSFAPGEATLEMAHKIGVELAQRLWGNRYQVVVATHLDKANHLHSHFVLNTVSFVDGIKYHRTAKDYHEMQAVSDALCREYGLSVIENPQPGKGKIWLPKTVAYILRDWRKSQLELKGFLGDEYQDFDLVVAQANGRPCEERILEKEFNNLKKNAGLPNVVFHSLRHSSTTYKLKLNHGDLKATQGDTGHAEIDMITKVYAHILDEDRKINAQKFECAFYANPDLRNSRPPQPEPQAANLNLAALVEQLQRSPELASTLAALLASQNPR